MISLPQGTEELRGFKEVKSIELFELLLFKAVAAGKKFFILTVLHQMDSLADAAAGKSDLSRHPKQFFLFETDEHVVSDQSFQQFDILFRQRSRSDQ